MSTVPPPPGRRSSAAAVVPASTEPADGAADEVVDAERAADLGEAARVVLAREHLLVGLVREHRADLVAADDAHVEALELERQELGDVVGELAADVVAREVEDREL